MSYDISKTNHIPMRVMFGTAGAEVELGYCDAGEITVTFNEEWIDQMAHQTGGRILESYYKGGNPTIQLGLLEVTDLAKWAIAFPTGDSQTDGASGTRFTAALNTAGAAAAGTPHVGQKASTYAKKLILRPVTSATTSEEGNMDLWFPKAFVRSVGDIQYGVDVAVVLNLTFGTLYVENAVEGEHLWVLGKSTGTWS